MLWEGLGWWGGRVKGMMEEEVVCGNSEANGRGVAVINPSFPIGPCHIWDLGRPLEGWETGVVGVGWIKVQPKGGCMFFLCVVPSFVVECNS